MIAALAALTFLLGIIVGILALHFAILRATRESGVVRRVRSYTH